MSESIIITTIDDEQELKKRADHAKQLKDEIVEREAKLASAITKLKALGLTETEAKIIIGIE